MHFLRSIHGLGNLKSHMDTHETTLKRNCLQFFGKSFVWPRSSFRCLTFDTSQNNKQSDSVQLYRRVLCERYAE